MSVLGIIRIAAVVGLSAVKLVSTALKVKEAREQGLINPIFAHNNSNGTMFAELSKFEDEAFFHEHGQIVLDTTEGVRSYEVISVIDVEVPSEEFTYFGWSNFDSADSESEFLRQIYIASKVEGTEDYTTGRQYLLLVTCEYTHVNGRRVVIAVRTP
jgi:sortase B